MQKKIDFGKMLAEYAIIVIFIVLFVVMSIFAPNFFTGNNMVNILRQVSISGICAVGMTFVMLTGGIDLSVGAIRFNNSISIGSRNWRNNRCNYTLY